MDPILPRPIRDLLIDPARIGWGCEPTGADDPAHWPPLGFLDLTACSPELRITALPPFPLIGWGDANHPAAATLDAVIEEPASAQAVLRQVSRAPRAAAVAVQLLRSLDGLPMERALMLESISYGMLQGSAEYQRWLGAREGPSRPVGAAVAPVQAPAGQVVLERFGSELRVTLDRPVARNAIDRAMRDQLFEALSLAVLDQEVRSIRLRAVGDTFSIGGDLDEFGTTRDPATAHLIRSRTLPALVAARCGEIMDVHVQGACVGAGLEIAAFARRVTASPEAWFQLPELAMGLIPGAGGCVSVPRRIGRQRAALLMLSGRRIKAADALRWGLIDAVESVAP
jgi:hypothetical protein